MKAKDRCWTCKARRIQCDGGRPACQKCREALRQCQGYGTRLSWPRDNDKRRAITLELGSDTHWVSSTALVPVGQRRTHFINATVADIELFRQLSQRLQPLRSTNSVSDPWAHIWNQSRVGSDADCLELVHYFHHSAHVSLVAFNQSPSRLGDVLLRMALDHSAVPGPALVNALLAFSSLRRNGPQKQALQFKIAALHALSASTNNTSLTTTEAAQHLAASMLLCSFELLLPSDSSDEWLPYINGAADIIHAAHLEEQFRHSDVRNLLDWFYYHHALSCFPVHHWSHNVPRRAASKALEDALARHRPAPLSPNPTLAILTLLSEACDALQHPRDRMGRNGDYHNHLKSLEARTRALSLTTAAAAPDSDTALAVEVYRVATQIYLIRAAQTSWDEPSVELDGLIDKGFAMARSADHCTHFYPLFIAACEARTDDQRATIMSFIGRSQKNIRARNMAWLRRVVQAVWIQLDLHLDSELLVDYLALISSVISQSSSVPAFV